MRIIYMLGVQAPDSFGRQGSYDLVPSWGWYETERDAGDAIQRYQSTVYKGAVVMCTPIENGVDMRAEAEKSFDDVR